ncbi:MAG: hypothetical protein WDO71_00470 [Bacteroidota bacterium]
MYRAGPTNNGGIIFEWFARQFGDFKNPFDLEHSMEELFSEGLQSSCGFGWIAVSSLSAGRKSADMECQCPGEYYFGLNIKHERQHFIRAAIEGILY